MARHHHHRRRRRRNPGLVGVAMQAAKIGLPALGTGAALGALDAVLGSPKMPAQVQKNARAIGVFTRLGVGLGTLMLLRNKPNLAVPIACAAFSTLGEALGHKVAGGVSGGSLGAVAKDISQIAAEDAESFGVVLTEMQGMGLLAVQGLSAPVDDAAATFAGTDPLPDNGGF